MSDFLRRLGQTIARSSRHKHIQSALLLLSIKPKTKLTALLKKLEPLTRCEDTILEISDEQVAVILEDFRHVSDPKRVAERLLAGSGKKIEGIAVVAQLERFEKAELAFQTAVSTLEMVSSEAPIRYSNKDLGEESQARLELEQDLEKALGSGKLVTYYQPIFNLIQGTVTGFEALVRWEHPQRGLLLPGEFLDIAEMRGQLLMIDELVLKQALTQIPIWNKESDRPIYVSANLCSDHFLKADNLEKLLTTLNAHPDSLRLLRIDVSEQVLFDQSGIDSLKALDDLHIGFNLDDFGVNSASFHCLGSFPFNSLKIDRALIGQMEDEVNAELIVAVLRIAKRMGMKTIAEGVVTHAQLEELRNLGCTEAQGFLFSEAVPLEKADQFLADDYCW